MAKIRKKSGKSGSKTKSKPKRTLKKKATINKSLKRATKKYAGILKRTVNIFRNKQAKFPDAELTVGEILEWFKDGKYSSDISWVQDALSNKREYDLRKNTLPAFTPAGTFSTRDGDALLASSGLACLDFDKLNSIKEAEAFRDELKAHPYILAAWLSPSARGVKALIRIKNVANEAEYKAVYEQLLKAHPTADPACSDLARLCFVSYDPRLWVNPRATRFNVNKMSPTPSQESAHDEIGLKTKVEELVRRIEKKKVDIAPSYRDWLALCYALVDGLGEEGREYLKRLSKFYKGEVKRDPDTQFNHCLKGDPKKKGKKTKIGTLFHLAEAKGVKIPKSWLKQHHKNRIQAIAAECEDPVIWDAESEKWIFNPSVEVIVRYMVRKGFRRTKNDSGFDWIIIDENNQCEILSTAHAASLFNEILLKDFPEATNLVNEFRIKYDLSALIPIITDFHRDTATEKFFYFINLVVMVTAKGFRLIPWTEIDKPVWKRNIIQRAFKDLGKGWMRNNIIWDFMKNIHNPKAHSLPYVMSVIGYGVHNYKKADEDQMIVIMGNQKVKHSDNKGAGSGKSLVASIFGLVGKQLFIPGDTFNPLDKFALQGVEPDHTSILVDDFVGKFTRLKTMGSGDWKIEKKHQPSFTLPKMLAPKILVTVPQVPDITDEGVRRRFYPWVVSDHYYKLQQKGDLSPIVTVHGKRFFGEDFTDKDWNGFYRFIIECSISYLKKRPEPKPVFKVLFDRLASQMFEDEELVGTIKKLALNQIIIIDNYYEKFKQENQNLTEFAKVFRKVLRSLNYKFTAHRITIARKGATPSPLKVDDRKWHVVKKGEHEKWGTGIKITEK